MTSATVVEENSSWEKYHSNVKRKEVEEICIQSILPLWLYYEDTMSILWVYYEYTMSILWGYYEYTMSILWLYYEDTDSVVGWRAEGPSGFSTSPAKGGGGGS